jgi:hypothetical protein
VRRLVTKAAVLLLERSIEASFRRRGWRPVHHKCTSTARKPAPPAHSGKVECFRACEEPPQAAHPWFEIVADIGSGAGGSERVSSRQRLNTTGHHWRAPEPGDTVPARWNVAHRTLQLDLGGDVRYDENVLRSLGRTLEPRTWGAYGDSSMP